MFITSLSKLKLPGLNQTDNTLDTSDATIVASQMLSGQSAYINGEKVIGTMPNHTAQTQVSDIKALVNLIINSSFENGTTGWSNVGSPSIVTTSSKFGSHAMFQNSANATGAYYGQNFNTVSGHKFYFSGWCKNTSNTSVYCDIASYGVPSLIFVGNSNTFVFQSVQFTCIDSTSHTMNVGWNGSSNNGAGTWLDGLTLIDLTTTFGVGNEPTKEQMDNVMNTIGGWFDGTCLIEKIPNGAYIASGITGEPEVVTANSNLIPSNIVSGVNLFGVVGNAIAGKRYANGSVTMAMNGSLGYYSVTISGLTFQPRLVYIITSSSKFVFNSDVNTSGNYKLQATNVFPAYVNSNGFALATNEGGTAWWYAYE